MNGIATLIAIRQRKIDALRMMVDESFGNITDLRKVNWLKVFAVLIPLFKNLHNLVMNVIAYIMITGLYPLIPLTTMMMMKENASVPYAIRNYTF